MKLSSAPGFPGKPPRFFRSCEALFLAVMFALGCSLRILSAGEAQDPLQTAFSAPPLSAKPQVWWHWMDSNITKEGITADLEAMQRIGIGGATIINVAYGIPPGPVKFMSPQWRGMVQHAVREGNRLGLEIGIANCDGYSSSGGPWITPEHSMQEVVTSELHVKGPLALSGTLAQPLTRKGYYGDIAVLAFPTLEGELGHMRDDAPRVSLSANPEQASKVIDGNPGTFAVMPLPTPESPQYIELAFSKPYTAQKLDVVGMGGPYMYGCTASLQASDDGKTFRTIREVGIAEGNFRQSFGFEKTTARYYRLLITKTPKRSEQIAIAEIELSAQATMDNRSFKTDQQANPASASAPIAPYPPGPDQIVNQKALVDLTSRMEANGTLKWNVPPGEWTILRIGHTTTGVPNHPSTPEGRGLETDKLDRQATDIHWNGMISTVVKDAGPLAGKTLNHILIDSYEVGSQNWTPRLREEFQKRCGYDLTPYLPAFSGRFVGSVEMTERFLWDLRRTIAGLFAENYFGRMTELAHKDGLLTAYEPYGDGPFDSLACGGRADIPMGEFWTGGNAGSILKMAASVGHLYGRPIVGAESFTATPQKGRWQQDPYSLKALGDAAFCQGINHFSIHRFAHQPWLDRFPGMTMGPWGLHFDRTLTWWEQGAGWMRYLARCQALLQQGTFVADALYFSGEQSPNETPKLEPALPPGYDYDFCNTEILEKLQVRDGRLIAPTGIPYRVLILTPDQRVTPGLLRKVRELVAAGAVVVGPKPLGSPSLVDYPRCDEQVKSIAGEIWGDCNGKSVTRHVFGKGQVAWGEPLASVLQGRGAKPDFEAVSAGLQPAHFSSIHRAAGSADFYFVSNQEDAAADAACTFRVAGRAPELWHPDSGVMEKAPVYSAGPDGRVTVPLHFDPAGSLFVVFREKGDPGNHAVAVAAADASRGEPLSKQAPASYQLALSGSGGLCLTAWKAAVYSVTTASGGTVKADFSKLPAPLEISGSWELQFPPKWGAPDKITLDRLGSWTKQSDPGVRYFSGTATYRKEIDLPSSVFGSHKVLRLDLGRVKNLAQVVLNGKDLGVLWKPPFAVDVTDSARPGRNTLEIRVTNLWPNRLIGDEQLPADCVWKNLHDTAGQSLSEWPQWLLEGKPSPAGRVTFTTWRHWTKDDPLLDSGLLGPVTFQPGLVSPIR